MAKERTLAELRAKFMEVMNYELTNYMNKAFPVMVKQVAEKDEARQMAERCPKD